MINNKIHETFQTWIMKKKTRIQRLKKLRALQVLTQLKPYSLKNF